MATWSWGGPGEFHASLVECRIEGIVGWDGYWRAFWVFDQLLFLFFLLLLLLLLLLLTLLLLGLFLLLSWSSWPLLFVWLGLFRLLLLLQFLFEFA